MTALRNLTLDQATQFSNEHWPAHNLTQGIDWKQQDFALGAYEGERLVGACIAQVIGGMACLQQIVVAYGLTQRGFGSVLLTAFEARARELGCHRVQLETAETQAPGFYERHGYERFATLKDGRFHLDWHLYAKQLL